MKNPNSQKTTISIALQANVAQYNLGQFQRLSNAKLYSIVFPQNDLITNAPDNTAIASAATTGSAYLTLQDHTGKNIVEDDPLYNYIPSTDFKKIEQFQGNIIDFTKSYIKFPSAANIAGGDVGKSIILNVEYEMIGTQ
jgi:hypothetical protein